MVKDNNYGEVKERKLVLIGFTLGLLTLLLFLGATQSTATQTLNYSMQSESGDPIVNVTLSLYNSSGELIGQENTSATGAASFTVDSLTDEVVLNGVIPSSNYHAEISAIKVPEEVFLNDVLSGSIRLINTLGQPLEAQDCSVVTMENDTGRIIKDYRTLCFAGEPYVDSSGNWASYSKCPFTDSNGNYYFNTIITEGEGYQTGVYYLLQFTCNAKTNSSMFYVDVPKPPDVGSWMEWARRYSGVLLIFIALFIAILILIYIVKKVT